MFISLVVFLLCGAVAGVFAGLLGVGGGIIIVPILTLVFAAQGIDPQHIHHLALGTSLASIMVTSVSSARTHYAKGAVRLDIVKNIAPGILLGTFLGGLVASGIPSKPLKIFFVFFLYMVALEMLFAKKPSGARNLPPFWGISCVGSGIGLVSSFVGIGGGTLSVPFLTYCSLPMHTAVGTSSAIGFPIALAGTIGYIVGGYGLTGLPDGALGHVHIWAFVGLATASFFTAPLGARLAHSLPVPLLKRFFAVFLMLMATRMLISVL